MPRQRHPRGRPLRVTILLFPLSQFAAKCCECGITYEECEADFANSSIMSVLQQQGLDADFVDSFSNSSGGPGALDCNELPKAGNGVCPAALPLPPAPPPSPPMQPEPPSWYGDLLAGLKFSAWLAWLAAGHPAWFPELLHLT